MKKRFRALLPVAAVALLTLATLSGCDLLNPKGFTLPAAALSGTVYLDPSDSSSFSGTVTGMVILDTDTDPSNGDVKESTISITDANLNSNGAIPYSLSGASAGTYYLYAYLDNDGTAGLQFGNGDAYGYYGRAGFGGSISAASTVVVPDSGWYNYDLWLSAPVL
jgi:hypothetical protein